MRDEQVEVGVDGYQTTTGQTRNEAGWGKEGETEKKKRKGEAEGKEIEQACNVPRLWSIQRCDGERWSGEAEEAKGRRKTGKSSSSWHSKTSQPRVGTG
jgi:hypothetical protein